MMRAVIWRDVPRGGLQTWALWLVDRMDAAGELPARTDRAWLVRRGGAATRTVSKYLAELERAGLIERTHTGRIMPRTDEYRHAVIIRAAARFREVEAAKPPARPANVTDLRNGTTCHPTPYKRVTEGHHAEVSYIGTGPNAREREDLDLVDADSIEQRRERAAAAENWPRLARARSDVPMLRPCAEQFVPPPPCEDCGRISHVAGPCQRDPRIVALDLAGRW